MSTKFLRKGLQTLEQGLQQSYTEKVSDTHRRLADLLIAQGRLSEAQQVLELLKLQELREFTRSQPVGRDSGNFAAGAGATNPGTVWHPRDLWPKSL